MRPPHTPKSGGWLGSLDDSVGRFCFMSPFYRSSALLLTTTLAFLIATGSAHAQNVTYTWQNAIGTWTNTTTAWLGSNGSTTGPQLTSTTNNTDTALFSNVGSGNNTVTLTSNRTVYGLVLSSTANAYTFTASNRALDVMSGGGLVNNSTQVQTFNMLVQNASGNGQWSSVAGGSLLFNSGVSLTTSGNAQSRTLTLAGAGTITVNSIIANGGTATAGAITVTSNGSTILSGNNTYGGVTTMNSIGGGTLTLSGNNSGAAGGVTLTAGTLNINHANALGTGALTISAGVTIANTSGAAITNLGNNAITFNDFTFGTANSTSSSNLDLGTGNVTMSSTRTITLAGTNTTLSMGFGNFTSSASGRTLTATGTGNTLVLRGLSLSQNATAAVTVTLAGSANIRIDGAIVPGTAFAHGVTITNTGTTTFNGTNTYTGATTISAGTLQLAKTASLYNATTANWTASSIKVSGGGTLALNVGGSGEFSTANVTTLLTNLGGANGGTSGGFASGSFIGFDTTNAVGNSFTVSDIIADSSGSGGGAVGLTKLGTNTLLLSGANTYNGNTTVSAGTLQIGNATALGGTTGGTTVASGATLAISGGLTVLSENLTLSGSGVGGGGALRSTSGSNTINSSTSASITIVADTTIGSDAGSTLTLTRNSSNSIKGTNFNLTLVGAGDFVFTRDIQIGTGGLTLNGTGSYTIGSLGSMSYTGNTTINSGTLSFGNNNRIADASSLIVNGGLLNLATRTDTVAGVTLTGGSITSSTGVLTSNANYDLQNGTISAILAGTVGANKTTGGTVTLSGNNTFSGGVNLSAGQLNINHAAAIGNGTLTINGGTLDNTSAAAITLSNNNAQNWNGDFAFTGTKDLNLGNGSVTMNSARTVTVSGGNLTVGGVIAGSGFGLTKNGIGNLVLTGANTYDGATVINAGTLQIGSGSTMGSLAVSSAITNNGTITFNRSDTLTQGTDFNGTISGTGNVIQAGSGSLILNGSNAYTGNTTISAGVLNIQHASALGAAGTGTTVASGAALELQDGISVGAEALSLSGSGVSSDGALRNISGTNSYAGAISLGSATRINSDADSLTLSGGITGTQNLSIGGSGNTTISNSIATSTGTLTKDGIGTLTLSANNTYTGATTVSAGTLDLSGGLNGSNITISGGSMLNQTSTGVIAGGGAILTISNGTATLAGNNTFAGGTTLSSAGTLNINHAYALGSGSLLTTGGTIDNTSGGAITLATTNAQSWNGTITFLGTNDLNLGTGAVTMSATRIVSVNAGNLTVGGVIGEFSAGYGLTKNGSGTLFLTGNNTYTGATTINAGTLNVAYLNNSSVSGPLGNTSGNSKLQFGDGTLQYTGSNSTSSDRGFRIIGNATFDASGNGSGATISLTKTGSVDSLFSGNKILTLTGSNTGSNLVSATMGDNSSVNTLAVVKSGVGTWVMSANNTYTGSTTISAGTLQIGSGSTSGALSASSAITNNGTLAFNRGSGSTLTQGTDFNSTISGTGNLIQAGSGTVVLNGANTYTGATTINAGTLSIASITNGGVAGALGSSTSAASNLVLGGGTLLYTGADGTTDRNFTLTEGTSSTINVTTALTISGSAATTSGNLTKAGAGTLTLSGNNTHTGATTVSAGTLALSGGLNGSSVTVSGGMLNQTSTGVISGSGTTFTLSSGNATLAGNNTYTGITTVGGGVLKLDSANALPGGVGNTGGVSNLTFSGGVIGLTNSSGDFSRAYGTGSTNYQFTGSGGFAAYGGNRTVNMGTFLWGSSGNFSGNIILGAADSDSTVTLTNNLSLRNNGMTLNVVDGSADVDAVLSGAIASYDGVSSRTFIKSGNGTVALTGDNTWLSTNSSSTFAINAGKVQIGIGGTAGSLGGTAVITNNGTLAFNRSDAINFTNTINGAGNVIQAGTGTTTLGAANGYSGTTSINSGALRATNATSLGTTAAGTAVSSGAALELSGGISIGAEALSLAGTGISSGGALRSVSGANAYTGEITLASASRINTDAGSLTLSGNTTGSNTNIALGGEGDTVVTGGLSLGSGTLTKDGGGTVTLNGSISYSGATALNAGKLVINGNNSNSAITIASGATLGGAGTVGAVTVNSGGFIAPGNSPGTLTVGDLTLSGGAGYTWEIANATGTAGTDWDFINVSGNTTITANSGNKFTVYINGTPTNWSSSTSGSWNIIDWGSVTGFDADAFAVNTASFGVPAAGTWAFSNTGGYLNLAYTAATTADWNGGTGVWSTGFSATPTNGYGVTYYGAGGTSANDIAAASLGSLASITFNGTAGAYTLNANSGSSGYDGSSRLTVTGGIANDSTADQTINLALDLTGAVSATGGNITLGGSIANSSGITLVGNKNITINEAISGSGSIAKTGNGTATLAGANTYTGTTTLNGGVIRVTNSSGLGSTAAGTEVASGGALELSGGISIGAEALELNGTGISNAGALRSISGTNSYAGNITLGSAARINSDADSLTLSGNISGAYALTKGGAGSLILSGNNTYSGATTISAGTLEIAGIASQTLSGIISGAGVLTKNGSGTLTLSNANTLTGGLTINSGTLTGTVAGAMGTASNTVTFGGSGGGVLNLQAAATTYTALLNAASANGTILINPAASGAGVTHTIGATTLGGGYQLTVQGGSNVASGTAQLTTGAITLNGNATVALLDNQSGQGASAFSTSSGITGTGNLTLKNNSSNSSSLITLATATVNHTGSITNSGSGNGSVTISSVIGTNVTGITQNSSTSTLRLTASNTFTSGVTINTGTVFVSAAASLGSSASTLYFAGGASSDGTLIISRGTTSPVSVNAKLDVTGGNGTIISDNNSAGAGQTYSLATPTLGGGYQLSVRGGGNVTSGTSVFQTTGTAITLNGNATIAVLDNLSGQAASAFNSSSGITGTGDLTLKNNSSNSSSYITLGTASVNHTGSITNSGSGPGSVTISSVIGTNVTGVTQSSATSALTLSGVNTYTGATTISAGTLTISSAGQLGSGTYAGNIANDGTFAYASSASQTLSGIMSGAGALTKNGSSTITLSGANTYTGGTTISAGTLTISGAGQLGSGIYAGDIANAGTFAYASSASQTLSGNITGAGALTKSGSSTLTLTGNNSYTGTTTISAGTIEVSNASALASNSKLETAGSITGNYTLNLASAGAYTMDSLSLKGIIIVNGPTSGGNATLTFTNGGNVTNNNDSRKIYSGANATIVFNGTQFDIGSSSNSSARVLQLDGPGNIVFNAAIPQLGNYTSSISNLGTGTLTLNASNTYNGSTTISAGTLVIASSGRLGAGAYSGNISNSGNFIYSGSNAQTLSGVISGSGALTQNSSAGTLTLSGSNTYTGSTTISAGNISISSTAALGSTSSINLADATSLIYTGAAGSLTRNMTVTSGTGTIQNTGSGLLTLSGSLTKNGTTLKLAGGSSGITVSGVISGSNANSDLIIDGGTTTLANANTYNGPTYIINGATLNASVAGALPTGNRTAVTMDATGSGSSTLALGANQSVSSLVGASTSNVTLASKTLTVGTSSGNTTFAGRISGTGNLVKDGASTQVLSGNNTFSGTTTVNSGTLQAAAANALGSASNVIVNNGGSFLVTADDAIGSSTNITLGSGNTTAGLIFSGNYNGTVGALTLSADSIIDLGTDSVHLIFASIAGLGNYNLSIWNWTGNAQYPGPAGGGTDQLVFTNASGFTNNLSKVSFYSGAGTNLISTSGFLTGSPSEIVAVPEPSAIIAAILLLCGLGVQFFRTRQSLGKRG